MAPKTAKVITKRRKFINIEVPIIRSSIELIGDKIENIENRTIKLDLTRQLKGKSIEAVVKVKSENGKAIAYPEKIKLMPYFIRRMIRKRISYVEDSFLAKTQESLVLIKPFLITRKRVSRAVRKTLRNKCQNWLTDYVSEKTNTEIFNEILTNRMQKPLSLAMKKTYPLSLCEIRVFELVRPLKPEEVPEIKPKEHKPLVEIEPGLDQFAEIEQERIKKAEEEIKETQQKASKIESPEIEKDNASKNLEEKPKKTRKKKEE